MSDEEMPPVRVVDPKEYQPPDAAVLPEPPELPPLPPDNPRPRLPRPEEFDLPSEPINKFVCTNDECPMFEVDCLNFNASITRPLCGGCSEPTERRDV